MSKPRIYELAKNVNINSKEIVEMLNKYSDSGKNHMSTLEWWEMDILLEAITQKYGKTVKTDNFKKDQAAVKPPASSSAAPAVSNPVHRPKKRYVNTRPSVVDLDKLDTEKIEQLVPVTIKDSEAQNVQKIKKSPSKIKRDKTPDETVNRGEKHRAVARKEILTVVLPAEITVGELAQRLKKSSTDIIKKLMSLGIMSSVNQTIDYETASLIAEDMGIKAEQLVVISDEDKLFNDVADNPEDLIGRSPVVVVMGHVDHGKTSLLDAIRKSNVTATEAGGITQHIGAYRVKIHGREITFLDTPGHEAFTAMRVRGAQVTDIAILVVAADDGIMPQTIEAINHAKAANVSIIVAINKMDKENANVDRIKQELTEYGLVSEEWGGDTICVPVSAIKKEGIDHLLEMILLIADMQELKANPNRLAKGTVIEALLDKGRGPVATVLVQNGTLNIGDIIVAGKSVGRVRAMMDDKGVRAKKAGPSMPVEILGLSEVPDGGDLFYVVEDEKKARDVVEKRKEKQKEEQFKAHQKVSLDDLFKQIKEGQVKDLNIIVKADVQGSVEAVRQSLEKLSNDEVRVRVIHGGVGTVTESDVLLASASNAIIVGFNVRPDQGTITSAARQEVDVRLYRIIYEAISEIESAMKGLLEPKFKEAVLGRAEVRNVFKVTGAGNIAGCYVLSGKIVRNCELRIIRDGIVTHEGTLCSLKRFKDDVKEVATGYECGIGIERFNDIKESDIIECFVMEEIK